VEAMGPEASSLDGDTGNGEKIVSHTGEERERQRKYCGLNRTSKKRRRLREKRKASGRDGHFVKKCGKDPDTGSMALE